MAPTTNHSVRSQRTLLCFPFPDLLPYVSLLSRLVLGSAPASRGSRSPVCLPGCSRFAAARAAAWGFSLAPLGGPSSRRGARPPGALLSNGVAVRAPWGVGVVAPFSPPAGGASACFSPLSRAGGVAWGAPPVGGRVPRSLRLDPDGRAASFSFAALRGSRLRVSCRGRGCRARPLAGRGGRGGGWRAARVVLPPGCPRRLAVRGCRGLSSLRAPRVSRGPLKKKGGGGRSCHPPASAPSYTFWPRGPLAHET